MSNSVADRISRIPSPDEPVPTISWPLVGLLSLGITAYVASSAAYLMGAMAWWATVGVNAVAGYLLFTVAHDTAHHSGSSSRAMNELMGRLSAPLFAPHASFPVWRFIHMQHHRFTNHGSDQDPDHYTQEGPAWQRPLRWATVDLYYVVFYLRHASGRPRKEQVEQAAQMSLTAVVAISIALTSGPWALAVVVLIPGRLTVLYLAWAFDYLPHAGLHLTPQQDRLKTTRNRIGLERLISPVLLYQNYHLVHHLHPRVPFHRYIAVWRRNEARYLDGEPALSTLGGRPLTADEYRRLRQLEHHEHE